MISSRKNLFDSQYLTRFAEKHGSKVSALIGDQFRSAAMTGYYVGSIGARTLLSRHLFNGDGFGVMRQVIDESQ